MGCWVGELHGGLGDGGFPCCCCCSSNFMQSICLPRNILSGSSPIPLFYLFTIDKGSSWERCLSYSSIRLFCRTKSSSKQNR